MRKNPPLPLPSREWKQPRTEGEKMTRQVFGWSFVGGGEEERRGVENDSSLTRSFFSGGRWGKWCWRWKRGGGADRRRNMGKMGFLFPLSSSGRHDSFSSSGAGFQKRRGFARRYCTVQAERKEKRPKYTAQKLCNFRSFTYFLFN